MAASVRDINVIVPRRESQFSMIAFHRFCDLKEGDPCSWMSDLVIAHLSGSCCSGLKEVHI